MWIAQEEAVAQCLRSEDGEGVVVERGGLGAESVFVWEERPTPGLFDAVARAAEAVASLFPGGPNESASNGCECLRSQSAGGAKRVVAVSAANGIPRHSSSVLLGRRRPM